MLSFKQFLSEEPDFAGTRGFKKAIEKEEQKENEEKFKEAQKAAKEEKVTTTDTTPKKPSPLPTPSPIQPSTQQPDSTSSKSEMLLSIKGGEPLKSSTALSTSDYTDNPILGSQGIRRGLTPTIKAPLITTGLSVGSLGKYSSTYRIA